MTHSRKATMRIHVGISTALAAGLLLAGAPVASVAAPADGAPGPDRRADRAQAALAAAQELFEPRRPDTGPRALARRVTEEDAEHASLVLRDLAVSVGELEGSDLVTARRVLARPTDGAQESWPGVKYGGAPTAHTCGDPDEKVCIHYVTKESHRDSPPLRDANRDGVPDWVEKNQQILDQVWQRTVGELGYRPPLDDSSRRESGPDGRTDIYLAELGRTYGLYGYCVPEPARRSQVARAYCVLDNDFSEYSRNPLGDLKATAAHEFFHAVQVGYHVSPDTWVAEGTAAWIEDEVFDEVNDNLQYLSHSALSFPRAPLDFTEGSHFNWYYGSWIFWRFLSEYFGTEGASEPAVVREIWERIGKGQESLPAVRATLAKRGAHFGTVFGAFGTLNRVAPLWYEEGRSYAAYIAKIRKPDRFTLAPGRRSTGWKNRSLRHLSSQHVMFRPAKRLGGAWKLRIQLDQPPASRRSEANVMVHRRDGLVRGTTVKLNRLGRARTVAPFNARRIAYVVVTLTNSSDNRDGQQFRFRATAVR